MTERTERLFSSAILNRTKHMKWTNIDPKSRNTTTITIYRTPWLLVIALCFLSAVIGYATAIHITSKLTNQMRSEIIEFERVDGITQEWDEYSKDNYDRHQAELDEADYYDAIAPGQ